MSGYSADPRIRWAEWLPWLAAIAFFFLMPGYLSLGARILIFILFALSLDLILGYAGIVTLGHSAFFGLGAYTAGALGAHTAITDPFAAGMAWAVKLDKPDFLAQGIDEQHVYETHDGCVFAHARERGEIDLLVVFNYFDVFGMSMVEVDAVQGDEVVFRDRA